MQCKGFLWLRYFAFFLVVAVVTVFFAACDTDGSTRWPSFTVVYISNGGSGTMADSVHRFGATYELSPNTFTRSGHSFDGWARTPGGPREFNDRQSVRNLADNDRRTVRLYARWVSVTQQPGNQAITINLTGIPSQYWWGIGDIALFLPGNFDWEVAFDYRQITGASASFTMIAAPGVYDLVLVLEDMWRASVYVRRSVNITAGTNTMSFASFDLMYTFWLSGDIGPSGLMPPGRIRSGELDVRLSH